MRAEWLIALSLVGCAAPLATQHPSARSAATQDPATAPPLPLRPVAEPNRRGMLQHRGPIRPVALVAELPGPSKPAGAPVLFEGALFVAHRGGTVLAQPLPIDGQPRWSLDTGRELTAGPVLSTDATVLVGAKDGRVLALRDGQVRWQAQLQGRVSGIQIHTDGTVHITAHGLYALDPDGSLRWRHVTADQLWAPPTLHPDGFVVVGTAHGRLLAVNLDGSRRWEVDAGAAVRSGASIATDGSILFGNELGQVRRVERDGSPRWMFETESAVRPTPTLDGDAVIVGTRDGRLLCLTGAGTLAWQVQTRGEEVRAQPRVDGAGTVYAGSRDHSLYAVTRDGGSLWSYNVGQDIDQPVTVDATGTLHVSADDGSVRSFR